MRVETQHTNALEMRKDNFERLEYRAVNVDAVNRDHLRSGICINTLPLRMVEVQQPGVPDIAILSWRWDLEGHKEQRTSLNIACAIRCAKCIGIKFLLIDTVSLDQTLSSDILLPQVAQFGLLYGSLPVIVAYDSFKWRLSQSTLRPWITNEMKQMSRNPFPITYAGYNEQGARIRNSTLYRVFGRVSIAQGQYSRFCYHLRRVWTTDLVETILSLLAGDTGMKNIHDFKLIMPKLAKVLEALEILRNPNDYLLLVALVASFYAGNNSGRYYHMSSKIFALDYTVIQILERREGFNASNSTILQRVLSPRSEVVRCYQIFWGHVEIATISPSTITQEYQLQLGHRFKDNLLSLLDLESECFDAPRNVWQENQVSATGPIRNTVVRVFEYKDIRMWCERSAYMLLAGQIKPLSDRPSMIETLLSSPELLCLPLFLMVLLLYFYPLDDGGTST